MQKHSSTNFLNFLKTLNHQKLVLEDKFYNSIWIVMFLPYLENLPF